MFLMRHPAVGSDSGGDRHSTLPVWSLSSQIQFARAEICGQLPCG
jgi:hypothetical protein